MLNADGSIPPEGMLHATYRGTDLATRLITEGIEFDADGRASQEQRLTAEVLKDLLTTETGAYQHKSYAYRGQRLDELDRFLRRMRVGDLVLATLRGKVYLGEVSGPARFVDGAPRSRLRRYVKWLNSDRPADGGQLTAPVPALLQSQAYVVDLTAAYEIVNDLVRTSDPRPPEPVPSPEPPKRYLAFHEVTDAVAENLLMDRAELAKITDLLWERRQIILYGPPGTGRSSTATSCASRCRSSPGPGPGRPTAPGATPGSRRSASTRWPAGGGYRASYFWCSVPADAGHYSATDHDSLRLSHAAYWVSLRDFKPLEGADCKRKELLLAPKANLLTVHSLKALCEDPELAARRVS